MDFDEIFKDLENAVIQKQEVICFKQQRGRRIRWVIEIGDREKEIEFEYRLANFFNRLRRKSNSLER